jgi:hypothetical protein
MHLRRASVRNMEDKINTNLIYFFAAIIYNSHLKSKFKRNEKFSNCCYILFGMFVDGKCRAGLR